MSSFRNCAMMSTTRTRGPSTDSLFRGAGGKAARSSSRKAGSAVPLTGARGAEDAGRRSTCSAAARTSAQNLAGVVRAYRGWVARRTHA
uniref:Uncharacterized protein n=1 Tax=Human herpesvirus 2 TaxID=10310 RepID=A0A481TDF0_HHV2|nr:hypothetical protein [Human alphaherpesvirus 2]QBH79945.1 hypothetical protein [Human alphaherpesvirus 2]